MDDPGRHPLTGSQAAEELFGEAHLRAPPERAAYVESACRDAPDELRAEVLSLLEHAEGAEAFFGRLQQAVASDSPWAEIGRRADAPAPAQTLSPGAIVGRYRIVERIGAGGMGAVYRAHDPALGRDVAIKLMAPHLAAEPESRERFLIEARAAAALDHPNIATIYEVGEADDGRFFLAMACYEGETLKERIARGPLPVGEAVACATQLARALAAAHARGIVHRDVKPGNVMLLDDGTVKLLDFGLARVGNATVTRPGATPGTVAYMSPEQVRGDHADHRTDLFSLGIVLYEMLAGVRPFRGENDRVVLASIAHDEPKPVRSLRPETPEPVVRAVERLLAKDPAARYGAAEELLAVIQQPPASMEPWRRRGFASASTSSRAYRRVRLAVATISLVAVGAVASWVIAPRAAPHPATTPSANPERILVADFANFTADPLLDDAVSAALRAGLARSPQLHVPSTFSLDGTLQRMGREPGARLDSHLAREVAVREGIRAVIDGEVRERGAGYVLSAVLVEASTGVKVDGWRQTARNAAGLIDAIDRLSLAIRNDMGESLTSLHAGEDLFQRTTESLEALRAHAQGTRAYFRGNFMQAAALFEEAIQLDPAFAHAYLTLAISWRGAGVHRGRSMQAYADAYQRRDRLSPLERHAVEGHYFGVVEGDVQKAIEAFRRQVEAAKVVGDVAMYGALGGLLARAGDLAGAETILSEARTLYPTAVNQRGLVRVLYRRGKLAEAEAVLEEARSTSAGHPHLLRLRAEMAAAVGDYAAADALADELPSAAGVAAGRRLRALTAAVRGRFREAIDHLAVARRNLHLAGYAAEALEIALVSGRLHIARGQPEAGLAELERVLADIPLDSLHPIDRPYLELARFLAETGDPSRARAVLGDYEKEVPQQFRGSDRWSYRRAQAAIHLGEGRAVDALADLAAAGRTLPPPASLSFDSPLISIDERPELARAYELAGHAESAVEVYTRYLAAHDVGRIYLDAFELPEALRRLASLLEARDDRTAAAHLYIRFAELWNDADPELRERAEEARRRASRLLEGRLS